METAWTIAVVIAVALIGMWTVMYLGLRAARDGCCPQRARRELHEALSAQTAVDAADQAPATSPSDAPARTPAGAGATVGKQRGVGQKAAR
jgi:hypothetical protein